MDKLYQDTINKNYTDGEIILIGPYDTLNIHIHKCVLGCLSDYFHNLFNFGQEKNQSVIEIKVDNVKIARDVIMAFFYGQKIDLALCSTKDLLEMFKCIPIYLLAKNWGEIIFVYPMILNLCTILKFLQEILVYLCK
jgi:hypothetical protein